MKVDAPQSKSTHLNGKLSIADYPKINSTKVSIQRMYILMVLQLFGSVNTIELQNLGVKHPSARIFELRKSGVLISSVKEIYTCHAGLIHKGVSRYFLPQKNLATQLPLFDLNLFTT